MRKLCPVCRKIPIFRREVHTCGSPLCLKEWRGWSAEVKEQAEKSILFEESPFATSLREKWEAPTQAPADADNEFSNDSFDKEEKE